MREPGKDDFSIDRALAEKLLRRDKDAEERVMPWLWELTGKFLNGILDTEFKKCHIEDLQQKIITKFLEFPEKMWTELAGGTYTFREFCAFVKRICRNETIDLLGHGYNRRARQGLIAGDDGEEDDGDPMDGFSASPPPTSSFEIKEHQHIVGRKVVDVYHSLFSANAPGKISYLAHLLLAARYFILKQSLEIEHGEIQPETGIQQAEQTIPWTDADGALVIAGGNPLPLQDLWQQAIASIVPGERSISLSLLAERVAVPDNTLNQRMLRICAAAKARIVLLTPPSEVAREALALINVDIDGTGKGTA